jgi:two-component system chemotaxis sensor kinase CheA
LQESSLLLETIANPAATDSTLKRALHTLKGNASSLGLSVIAMLCHRLEDGLTAQAELPRLEVAKLQERWKTLNEHITKLAPNATGSVEVPEHEIAALIALLGRSGQSEALERIQSWKLEPVSRSLARLAEQARILATKLGKGEIDVEVEVAPTSLRLDPRRFGSVFSELAHVIRNAVDHGLEAREERMRAGKQRKGRISLCAAHSDDSLVIEVGDDGRGMDADWIHEKGSDLNLVAGQSANLVEILCHKGFSTATEVTETSGRGVGMFAVKRCIESLGGRVELQTAIGRGTTWRFVVPLGSPSAA